MRRRFVLLLLLAGLLPGAPAVAASTGEAARRFVLPPEGSLHFVVVRGGMQIGRAVHRWAFRPDGSYHLHSAMETTGLAALIKPLRQENDSTGHLGPKGLRPAHFRVLLDGRSKRENADFDWSTAQVRLERNGSVQAVAAGSQDLLSLYYQLAYLESLPKGATIGVVTGRKYEVYRLEAGATAEIELPAGRFRTLYLRAAGGKKQTEFWVTDDARRLPVRVRFTDKRGDSYELRATEIDLGGSTAAQPARNP